MTVLHRIQGPLVVAPPVGLFFTLGSESNTSGKDDTRAEPRWLCWSCYKQLASDSYVYERGDEAILGRCSDCGRDRIGVIPWWS